MSDPNTDQPASTPKRQFRITPARVFLPLVGVVAAIVVVGSILSGGKSNEPTSNERLCALLDTGWTPGELVYSDVWVDWPETMSRFERETRIVKSANVECPEKV
ncbi:hypothetical protein [Actinophytocola oryzae]|uniref:Uncharacterized protein n=1 Tax=Actinophytocola oryzae TaxID=502181 RepID=A0A4V3FQL2_9PSEU|nr:hypothetical protein [Actinophytocola oryzae]TDV40111.1 hypothetical protein CLV71_124130 [Actinophytocola oryzae]